MLLPIRVWKDIIDYSLTYRGVDNIVSEDQLIQDYVAHIAYENRLHKAVSSTAIKDQLTDIKNYLRDSTPLHRSYCDVVARMIDKIIQGKQQQPSLNKRKKMSISTKKKYSIVKIPND